MKLKAMKLMLISALAMLFLASCGGGSGSNPSNNINTGVAQKGPFSIGSNITITKLDASGISTGSEIQSKVSSKSGSFSYKTDSSDLSAYYRMQATGRFLDENTAATSEDEINLSTITNNPNNSSINVLTHWLSKRTDALLASNKPLNTSLEQAQEELFNLFGIENFNSLDVTTSSDQLDNDNALLLLLSGALMEASQKYKVSSQTLIDEIGEDFADDGQLSEKGDDWFIRLQALIKNNPSAHTKKYAKAINDKLGYTVSLDKKLPAIIPLASRPVANVPTELLAEPSETIALDGSASHDSGDIINFTWFRVDQQTQYNVQVSDRFIATPTITVPDEATVLAAPNQEISLLYALAVTDADKLTHTGVVKVTIKIPPLLNNPPVANSQVLVTDEDSPIAITLSASDSDGDTINFVLSSTPLSTPNGLVVLEPSLPNVVYTPSQDYFGTDSFTFLVNDGFANSNTATVDIQVNPVNDPPIADDKIIATDEDTPVTIVFTGSDIENDFLSFRFGSNAPNNGALSGTIPNVVYTPESNFIGSDSFDYIANDGVDDSVVPATVNIVVNPVNDPPIANAGDDIPESFSGEPLQLNGSGSDFEDGTNVTYQWSSPPEIVLSNINISNPTFTAPNVTSQQTFTISLIVRDTELLPSPPDQMQVTVNPPGNNRPVARAGPDQDIGTIKQFFGATFIESTASISLDGSASSDVEDATPSLTFDWTQVSGPVSIDPDNLIGPMFNIIGGGGIEIDGDYVFSLVVIDSAGSASVPEEITITVGPNQPPVANNLSIPLDLSGIPTPVTLIGNDPDGNNANLIYEIVTLPPAPPFRGTLNVGVGPLTGNIVEYESNSISSPDPDSFTYRVIDELGLASNIATVNLTSANHPLANAGPDRPLGYDGEQLGIELDGTASSDPNGSILTYSWERLSSTATIYENNNFVVDDITTPQAFASFSGSTQTTVTFRLTVTNNIGLTDTDDVVYTIQNLPFAGYAEVCFDDLNSTPETIGLTGTDSDGDDNALRFKIISLPNNGTLNVTIGEIVGNEVIYTPPLPTTGLPVNDSFTFSVIDEQNWESYPEQINLIPNTSTSCP